MALTLACRQYRVHFQIVSAVQYENKERKNNLLTSVGSFRKQRFISILYYAVKPAYNETVTDLIFFPIAGRFLLVLVLFFYMVKGPAADAMDAPQP